MRQGETDSFETITGTEAVESRALVALESVVREPSLALRQVTFLAQLIATKDQHPQTRSRRRAEPQEAIVAYRAASARLNSH